MAGRTVRALLVGLLVVAAACSGGGGRQAESEPSSASTAPTTGSVNESTQLDADQTAHSIGVTFQYEAFAITLGTAIYDMSEQKLLIGVRYRNLGNQWFQPNPLVTTLRADGQDLYVEIPLTMVPPGASTDLTAVVRANADPFEGGVILWGRDTERRVIIDLAQRTVENGELPIDVRVDTWGSAGRYTIHVNGAHLLTGALGRVVPTPEGERVLRLDYDLFTARYGSFSGFAAEEHLTLRRPDGSVVSPIPSDSSEARNPMSWTSIGSNWTEFPVKEPVDGDYELLLTGSSTLLLVHPELLVRVPIPLRIDVPTEAAPTAASAVASDLPQPALDRDPSQANGESLDQDLDIGSVNVPGFTVTPSHLRFDPAMGTVSIDGAVSYIRSEVDNTAPGDHPATGLLSAPPQFAPSVALLSGRTLFYGTFTSEPITDRTKPSPITLKFEGIERFALATAVLYLGPSRRAPSTLPLGDDPPLPRYPASIAEGPIEAQPVTAGKWTVTLTSYRLGLFNEYALPDTGELDLEVFFDITVSPSATVPALGHWFTPYRQVFISGATGYLTQPFADGGAGSFQPGQSKRLSAIFHVNDAFQPGPAGFVVRSGNEAEDFAILDFIEVTVPARIGAPAAAPTLE